MLELVSAVPGRAAANEAGVDPALVLAIAMQESSGKQAKYGSWAINWGERAEILGCYGVGVCPDPNGPSLGITNLKPNTAVTTVLQNYSSIFGNDVSLGRLITDPKLDLRFTAYYVKYLNKTYVADAPANVSSHYSKAEITYGIYQGGENNYRQTVRNTGQFGSTTKQSLPSFSSYYSVSTLLLCGGAAEC